MARPKYEANSLHAREALIHAFWECLEQEALKDISVLGICRRAHLNRNTFYYHFETMEDMIDAAVSETLSFDVAMMLAIRPATNPLDLVSAFEGEGMKERFDHVVLLAGKNSTVALQEKLKDSLRAVWYEVLGVRESDVSQEEKLELEFCLGGIMALLAMKSRTGDEIAVGDYLGTPFFKRVLAHIDSIACKQGRSGGL